jgi:hypothetical protein
MNATKLKFNPINHTTNNKEYNYTRVINYFISEFHKKTMPNIKNY